MNKILSWKEGVWHSIERGIDELNKKQGAEELEFKNLFCDQKSDWSGTVNLESR
jgi:hypothetical protein